MPHPIPIPDRQIEANIALIAAEILMHPLALQLPSAIVELLAGVAAGDMQADPHAVRVLRLTLIHIDALEIAASLGVAA
ncbi:MAG TPA: hypothetical protein VGF29_00315 [Hyphomicrobiaceae bacterium]|jgi:hypothetical protein